MAKKQTRRCVSLNRNDYEAAKLEAARRGVTLTALVEFGLAAIGVPVVRHPQQTPELARMIAECRAKSVAARREGTDEEPRSSRESQMLDAQAAVAFGGA